MRQETTTRNIYKYDELSEKQKEKALEHLWDINIDYIWYDYDGMLDLSIKECKDKLHYIFINKHNTEIEFQLADWSYEAFTEREQTIIDRAEEIFSDKVFEAWKCLRDDYKYRQGREAIEETIELNEYEFDEEGKLA